MTSVPPTHDCSAIRFASTEIKMDKPLDVKDLLRSFYPVLILVAAVEVLLWVHWNSLVYMANMWDNDKYSHGYLVPLFAIGLMWWYRKDETTEIVKPVAIAGGVLVGFGLLLCGLPLVAWDLVLPLINALGNTVLEAIGVGCAVAGAFLLLQPRLGSSDVPIRDRWIGFAILMGAEALRVFATLVYIDTLEAFTFIPALAGVFVMAGGLRVLRWSGWPIVFLMFMVPLPGPLVAERRHSVKHLFIANDRHEGLPRRQRNPRGRCRVTVARRAGVQRLAHVDDFRSDFVRRCPNVRTSALATADDSGELDSHRARREYLPHHADGSDLHVGWRES
jgi:Transmembrane exosortase (Exosortase_EpsH)